MAESAELSLRPAVAVGRGGDGRPLLPKDNGGPEIIDTPPRESSKKNVAILSLVIAGIGTGAFLLDTEELLRALEKGGHSVEDFLAKLTERLYDIS